MAEAASCKSAHRPDLSTNEPKRKAPEAKEPSMSSFCTLDSARAGSESVPVRDMMMKWTRSSASGANSDADVVVPLGPRRHPLTHGSTC